MGAEFTPEQRLANAIIVQAARDYYMAASRLEYDADDKAAQYKKKRLQKFFHSSWYELLTDLDPEYIMKRIDGKVKRRTR